MPTCYRLFFFLRSTFCVLLSVDPCQIPLDSCRVQREERCGAEKRARGEGTEAMNLMTMLFSIDGVAVSL